MIVKCLLVLLLVYRLLAAIFVEPIFALNWPIDYNQCEQACDNKPFEQLCVQNCNMRRNINMDLLEYSKIDKLVARQDIETQIIGYEAIILSLLLPFAVLDQLGNKIRAKKLGLVCSGMYFFMLAPYFYKSYLDSPNPTMIFVYNWGGIAFFLLLLVSSWNIDVPKLKQQ